MNPKWVVALVAVALGLVAYFALFRNTNAGQEVEYSYAPVTRGELIRSTSANGTLVALTKVDVKSKAGGRVVRLAVDEGSLVKKGDLIATIDPSDTRSVVEQANADVNAAQARVASAEVTRELDAKRLRQAVAEAQNAVELSQVRLKRAQETANRQPAVTAAALSSAQEAVKAQTEALAQLVDVESAQRRRDAEAALSKAKVDLENARSSLERQQALLEKGYVAKTAVEQARGNLASAQSAFASAQQRSQTIEKQLASEERAARSRLAQAKAELSRAEANRSDVVLAQRDVEEAKKNLEQAKIRLQTAQTDLRNMELRKLDVTSAEASAVRSRVARENAQVQLDSTTVVAPRDGVVTTKYLEEGTIVPPGTSTFSQGTSIVEISDVSRMFVDCQVDEADIGSVRNGQSVRIIVEAYPGSMRQGIVRRIYPAATVENSLTRIRVRAEILPDPKQAKLVLRPGMTASCEFILLDKTNVLIIPAQAVKREGDKTLVKVKTSDPLKPETREVELGAAGNEGYEVIRGLSEGEEVVVSEIDLKELRERQQKIEQSEKGGGITGAKAAKK